MPQILQGRITAILSTHTPWFLGVMQTRVGELTAEIRIVGQTDYHPRVNADIEVIGKFELKPRFGRQFSFTYLRPVFDTSSTASLVHFLRLHCPGFHRPQSSQVIRTHGLNTVSSILAQPQILQQAGFSPLEQEETVSFLQKFGPKPLDPLERVGLPCNTVRQAKDLFGLNGARRLIRYVPYAMVAAGATIEQLDAIFPTGKGRDLANAWLSVHAWMQRHGSTAIPKCDIRSLGIDANLVRRLERWKLLIPFGKLYSLPSFSMQESFIASWLSQACRRTGDTHPSPGALNEEQSAAVRMLLQNNVFLLTGGPGTGKTHVVGQVLPTLLRRGSVALLAPTGKAAKRLSASAHHEAVTIHRFLHRLLPLLDIPLEDRMLHLPSTVIIDEFSMVDTDLFFQLLRLLPTSTRLILLGDADQLPSITPGNLLRDLCNRIPTFALTTNMRQGGLILSNAIKINAGSPDLELGSDFSVFSGAPESLIERLKAELDDLRGSGYSQEDIQVLSPAYQGELGIERLNRELGNKLNPHPEYPGLDVGDRVVVTENLYRLGVVNGDAGTVTARTSTGLVVSFGGWETTFGIQDVQSLQPAWALSTHKAQGSEYRVVLLCLHHDMPLQLLSRALLYTAVTRAREKIIIFGSWSSIEACLSNTKADIRLTLLPSLLDKTKAASSDAAST